MPSECGRAMSFRAQVAFRMLVRLRRGSRSRARLADSLEVSVVTINRLIRDLRAMGAPLCNTIGAGAGNEMELYRPVSEAECAAWAAALVLPWPMAELLIVAAAKGDRAA